MATAVKKIDRTMSGLRDVLFETFEDVRAGTLKPEVGMCCVGIAKVIVETVKVQMLFERMRLDSKVPAHLPEMKLLPPLGK